MKSEESGYAVRQMEREGHAWNQLMDLNQDIQELINIKLRSGDMSAAIVDVTPEESVAIYNTRQLLTRLLVEAK